MKINHKMVKMKEKKDRTEKMERMEKTKMTDNARRNLFLSKIYQTMRQWLK